MAKLTTPILIYATLTALFLLLLLRSTPQLPSSSYSPTRRHHRRLKLRSPSNSQHHHSIPFDPIVADIERHREDLYLTPPAPGHEASPEWEEFMDAEDYINDEKRFNMTDRLVLLFPSIDKNPRDGFLSVEELTEWNVAQTDKEILHRTERDLDAHDKNKDGFVSFEEYETPKWTPQVSGDAELGWWKKDHFNVSDADGNGLLNLAEFNDFLHPADSKNPNVIHWLCTEEIRERDRDKDGKLNFQEFFRGLFDSLKDYSEDSNASHHDSPDSSETSAKKLFSQIDRDNDGFLSADELKSILDNIHPSERFYAKQQADHMISQADSNKDGRLSLEEIVENPYVFYSAIFDDDDDYFHDEFR
ncbi:Calcium-binding EF hand family protein [Zostera marina]|uniref:Calcium-binding EF hand family protein n=1 Tax=Zostera marina TaxID=29655 RepID=A0A0K9PIS5_ZOSMR|nr:Calcium-binding EF hand family protein [Zostera marina]